MASKEGSDRRGIGAFRGRDGAVSGGKRGWDIFLRFAVWQNSESSPFPPSLVSVGIVAAWRVERRDSMSVSRNGAPVMISALSRMWIAGDSHEELGWTLHSSPIVTVSFPFSNSRTQCGYSSLLVSSNSPSPLLPSSRLPHPSLMTRQNFTMLASVYNRRQQVSTSLKGKTRRFASAIRRASSGDLNRRSQ